MNKPRGWIMYTSSSNLPWRKAFFTSNCFKPHLYVIAIDNTICMVCGLTILLNVLEKSTPGHWWKPFATNLALFLSIEPSDFLFILKIYLLLTRFCDSCLGTKLRVLLAINALNSGAMFSLYTGTLTAWVTHASSIGLGTWCLVEV